MQDLEGRHPGTTHLAEGYYAAVRGLERRWPAVGWLLGAAKAPNYGPPPYPRLPTPRM